MAPVTAILKTIFAHRMLNPRTGFTEDNSSKMENRTYRDPITGQIGIERRSNASRRTFFSFWDLFSKRPRRRKSCGRRRTDKGAYIDSYDSKSWGIVIAVLVLSFLDAFLTRRHLVRGTATELNPFLDAIIDHGGLTAFYIAKAAMTVFPMALILVHKEWTLGKYAARLCLFAYILLTIYHLYLIFGI
jgi:hypothetical protein